MYNSNITVRQLYSMLLEDVDIAVSVNTDLFCLWLDSLQQMLYSEIIRHQRYTSIEGDGDAILFSSLAHADDEAVPEARDIVAVFADNAEAQRVSGGIGRILHGERPAWYDGGSGICLLLPYSVDRMQVAHIVRPAAVTSDKMDTDCVRVPSEFVPMVLARMRGEMYKVANEDMLSAKWLSDYNTELETFKVWAVNHNKMYGA